MKPAAYAAGLLHSAVREACLRAELGWAACLMLLACSEGMGGWSGLDVCMHWCCVLKVLCAFACACKIEGGELCLHSTAIRREQLF